VPALRRAKKLQLAIACPREIAVRVVAAQSREILVAVVGVYQRVKFVARER
jgi:hypothetical protein